MTIVTISPKLQVVILAYDNRIEFIPVRALEGTRGFLQGIDTVVHRESDQVGDTK